MLRGLRQRAVHGAFRRLQQAFGARRLCAASGMGSQQEVRDDDSKTNLQRDGDMMLEKKFTIEAQVNAWVSIDILAKNWEDAIAVAKKLNAGDFVRVRS